MAIRMHNGQSSGMTKLRELGNISFISAAGIKWCGVKSGRFKANY